MKNIIAVDIGGTNSRFAHFELDDDGTLRYVNGLRLKTGDAGSLDELIEMALAGGSIAADAMWDAVVLAVPGAVKKDTYAKLANVPWAVDVSGLRQRSGTTKIFLINDFVAQAFSCPLEAHLKKEIIQPGQAEDGATRAVIGAGTGLGHCALITTGPGTYAALPSEAGHAAFPFYGKTEIAYQKYLLDKTGTAYPFGDIVVSGPGLSHLHAFLTGQELLPEEVAGQIGQDSETTALFARFYARACRNYTLTVLAMGGLYIAGGVAMKNPFLVVNEHFRKEFTDSSHYRAILEKIPVSLILSEDSGLWGAAHFGVIGLQKK